MRAHAGPWIGAGLAALAVLVGCMSVPAPQETLSPTTGAEVCTISRIVDGDTVGLSCPGAPYERGRLMGFDTPEIFSPKCVSERQEGLAAKAFLRRQIAAADRVEMAFFGRDRYGRRLLRLSLDGRDVAGVMIGAGLARVYDGGRREGWCT